MKSSKSLKQNCEQGGTNPLLPLSLFFCLPCLCVATRPPLRSMLRYDSPHFLTSLRPSCLQIYVEYAVNDVHQTESEHLPIMDNIRRRPHERMIRKVRRMDLRLECGYREGGAVLTLFLDTFRHFDKP